MKGAIASVELFAFDRKPGPDVGSRRLSLVIGAPERRAEGEGEGETWHCRVALADLYRPESISGRDSFDALARAVDRARSWIDALEAKGFELYCDRAGERRFELP